MQRANSGFLEGIEDTAAKNDRMATYHQLDCTDADAYPPLFDKIRESLRHPLRGLVACAGISGEGDATEYRIDQFRKIVDVNVAGTFLVTQAVGREMHKAGVTGSVVIIASMSGTVSNRVSRTQCLSLETGTDYTEGLLKSKRESTPLRTMRRNQLCFSLLAPSPPNGVILRTPFPVGQLVKRTQVHRMSRVPCILQ